MADAPRRSWSRSEVQEILRRASEEAGSGSDDGVRHEELLAAAREAGFDPEAVESAARELAAGETERQALARVTDTEIARRKRRFRRGALSWAAFSAFSALAYLLLGSATGALWPFAAPALVWGFFVSLSGVRAFTAPEPEEMTRRLDKERRAAERDRTRKRAREAAEEWTRKLQDEIAARRSRSETRKGKALELEDAIEDGVRAVLAALARAAKEAIEPRPSRADGEFARYVEHKKGAPARPARDVRVDPDAARARVRVDAHENSDDEDPASAGARQRSSRRARS